MLNVIMAVYNGEQYVRQAVLSVVEQPLKDLRLIVVDDGSTDNTISIVSKLADKYNNIVLLQQPNQGAGTARNNGIDWVLQHEFDGYLSFIDSDDLYYPEFLNNDLEAELALNCDILAYSWIVCNSLASRYQKMSGYEGGVTEWEKSLVWNTPKHICSAIYSVRLFKKFGLRFFHYKYSEDKYFLYQAMYLADKVYYSNKCMYIYRRQPSSLVSKAYKVNALDYYIPIIQGWTDTDRWINEVIESPKAASSGGRSLAGIYFMDMAILYFEQHGTYKKLIGVMESNPNYDCFLNLIEVNVSPGQWKKYQLLRNHPRRVQVICNIIGCIKDILYGIKHKTPIGWLMEQHTYRYKMENIQLYQ